MHADLLEALALLGVEAPVDERDVRRAYARTLKVIDQEADPQGFQRLREAYERVMARLAEMGGMIDAHSAAPEPESEHESEPKQTPSADAGDDAAFVFSAHFEWACTSADDARQRLARCLASPRLNALDQREAFEEHVVRVLAQGWSTGQQFLWVAALECFQWEADRGRVRRFREGGEILEAAIIERDFIKRLSTQHRQTQRQFVHRLRNPKPPTDSELIAAEWWLRWVTQTIPHWLALNTDMQNVRQWQVMQAALMLRIEAEAAARQPDPLKTSWVGRMNAWILRSNGFLFALVVLVLAGGMLHLMTRDSPRLRRDAEMRAWAEEYRRMRERQQAQAASPPETATAPATDKDVP